MTIYACDIDGVVANFSEGFSQLLNRLWCRGSLNKYQLPIIENNQTTSWDWKEWYALDEISREDLKVLVEEAWEDHIKKHGNVLWSTIKPLFPDTMEYLNEEARENPIVFMTRRDGPSAWQETSSWLHRYGIDNPMVYVIRPGEEKGEVCQKMGIDTIIDDNPRYAEELLDKNINVVMPVWDYNSEWISENKKNRNLHVVSDLSASLTRVKAIQRRSLKW